MFKDRLKTIAGLAMLSVLILLFSACSTTGGGVSVLWGDAATDDRPPEIGPAPKGGPPPHAPAHGYRRKYAYRYYPNDQVYYDVDRRLYFYLAGGNWKVAVALPSSVHLDLGGYVRLEMDSDIPYVDNVKHRKKYPPGKAKKKKKHKKK